MVIDGDSREFYEEAAAAAASLAVCIDLYVASPAAVGLRCLQPLAVSSGGVAYLYPSLEESALPQVIAPVSPAHACRFRPQYAACGGG